MNRPATREHHAGARSQPGTTEETAPALRAGLRELDLQSDPGKSEDSASHEGRTIAPGADRT